MTNKIDISFTQVEGKQYCDIAIADHDIVRDNTLISAVSIMLLSDRRATVDELQAANLFPSFPYDRRGWWGDSFRETPIGSKLWLNRRRKATDQVLLKHKKYAEECLLPLKTKGIVKDVIVQAVWARKGVMIMNIQLIRPDNSTTQQQYTFTWNEVQNAIH
jgi:phage gp46-like protein